jgi:hypothetical protein
MQVATSIIDLEAAKAGSRPAFYYSYVRELLPSRLAPLAAAASAAVSAPAARAALRARARFVDIDRAAVQLVAVELLDSLGRRRRFHFDKRETARATRISIRHYSGGFYRSNFRKQIGKLILRRLVRQVTYKYSHCLS